MELVAFYHSLAAGDYLLGLFVYVLWDRRKDSGLHATQGRGDLMYNNVCILEVKSIPSNHELDFLLCLCSPFQWEARYCKWVLAFSMWKKLVLFGIPVIDFRELVISRVDVY